MFRDNCLSPLKRKKYKKLKTLIPKRKRPTPVVSRGAVIEDASEYGGGLLPVVPPAMRLKSPLSDARVRTSSSASGIESE